MKGLYFAKAWYTKRLGVFIRYAVRKNISADVFTWIGVLFAVVAAVGLVLVNPLIVLVGLAGRLGGANLDGAVARARGTSRPFGFVLNEIGDRLSDMIIFTGFMLLAYQTSSTVCLLLAALAALLSTLPTLTSISTAGAGGARYNGGPLGKTERALIMLLVSIILLLNAPQEVTLNTASILLGFGALVTFLVRTLKARKDLS
jgi:CDP-diacylglycerol--glycerol-3-phosphate 3-phosphatidyltransferase